MSEINNEESILNTETNGKLIINNQVINVYDDTAIKNALKDKANNIHNHTFNDISDFDSSIKTDGDIIMYDSSAGKFVSKALTSSGATNLDELSDVDVTSIPPVDGDILTYSNNLWNPKNLIQILM